MIKVFSILAIAASSVGGQASKYCVFSSKNDQDTGNIMPKIKLFSSNITSFQPEHSLCRQPGGATKNSYRLIKTPTIEFSYQEAAVPVIFNTLKAMWEIKKINKDMDPSKLMTPLFSRRYGIFNKPSLSIIPNTLPNKLILRLNRTSSLTQEVLEVAWNPLSINQIQLTGYTEF
jgi:hypothetical protein